MSFQPMNSEPKDLRLEESIEQVLNGDRQAFVHIVEAYQQQIFMYCWRLLNQRQDAEDAVQEIMVKAYQKLETYEPKTSFSSWLYKIAYHHCLNMLRRRRFFHSIAPLLRTDKEQAESAEQEAQKYIIGESMERALRRLTPEERNLLILRVFEEKSFAEIGLILDKTKDSVKKRYSRLIQKIKKWMVDREGDLQWKLNEMTWKKS
ncbi:RNA polymerase sigma factor [Paenibacillus lautus]|uniref:RNA polymerase sigma factor n=1 Tax=Paenibacillus lautus TaxID=1401 RepID=UPI003D2A2695